MHQETTHSNEVETENTAETRASAPSAKRLRGKPTVADQPAKPGSRIAAKTPGVRPMRDCRETPTDEEQLADEELRRDVPPAKHSKPNANALKGSNVRRTRVESEEKQVIISPLCFHQVQSSANAA